MSDTSPAFNPQSIKPALIQALIEAWEEHPAWTFGRLLQSAASIARGELRVNPAIVGDGEMIEGLRALVPSEWEKEKDQA